MRTALPEICLQGYNLPQTAFWVLVSPCGCPCPQPAELADCIVFTLCMWPQQTPILCAVVTTQLSERAPPAALTVLWWRFWLSVNGACISDAFDNHVHISELPWWRHRPDWLIVFCLSFFWNKSWMTIPNTSLAELAYKHNFTMNVNPCVCLIHVFSTITKSRIYPCRCKADTLYYFDRRWAYILYSRCLADWRQMLQTHVAHVAFTSMCWDTLLGH